MFLTVGVPFDLFRGIQNYFHLDELVSKILLYASMNAKVLVFTPSKLMHVCISNQLRTHASLYIYVYCMYACICSYIREYCRIRN